jgi:UPF0755 protein
MSARDSQISHPHHHRPRSKQPWWLWVVLALVAIVLLVFIWYWQALRPTKTGVTAVIVNEGESTDQIAKKLDDKKLIRSERAFQIYVRTKGLAAKFQAGRFSLNGNDSTPKIAVALTEQSARAAQFTIREGLTQQQIADQLDKQKIASGDEFAALKASDFTQYTFLQGLPADAPLEGFLFPETYTTPPEGTSAKDVATIMLNQFDKELTPDLRQQIQTSGRSLYETIIIASMLEEEVKTPKDRRMVAGIIEKRLDQDIRLDIDATLRYGLDKLTGTITQRDLDSDSPYNTRKVKGLPPTPISNPGLASIEATLNPEASEYLFYLSAKDGTTHFAKTNDEHEKNKDKYL